jgi:peptidoglycan/LPS O-acetylase OafA/YrhL
MVCARLLSLRSCSIIRLIASFPAVSLRVDIFFVLSGYLITTILVREFDNHGRIDLRNFYIRRCLRLMPALFVMLAVYAAAITASAIILERWAHTRENLWAALAAATYTMNWAKGFNPQCCTGGLIHTWSLAVEEQFYLVWPVMLLVALRVLGRAQAWRLCLVLIVCCICWRAMLWAHGADPNRTYMGLDTRFDTLQWGCLLALAPASVARLGWRASRFVVVPVTTLTFALLFLKWDTKAYQVLGMPVIGLCAAWIILAVMTDKASWLADILSTQPLRYLGSISYGFYLWHYLAVVVAVELLGWGWLAALATFGLTFMIAALSYRLVELPFLKLREQFQGGDNHTRYDTIASVWNASPYEAKLETAKSGRLKRSRRK